jgi:hypothetical protein
MNRINQRFTKLAGPAAALLPLRRGTTARICRAAGQTKSNTTAWVWTPETIFE